MMARLSFRRAESISLLGASATAAVGLITVGLISFDITLNQALAITFSAITLTLWAHSRLSGLISAIIFFLSKSFWVRLAYAIESGSGGNRFDLLGVAPALFLAGLIIWQMLADYAAGRRLCPDRTRRLLIVFAAISLGTVFYCGSPLVGLGGFERNVLPNMMILFLAATVLTSYDDAGKLLKALMVFGLISSVYAIGQYFSGLYPWEMAWFRDLAWEQGLSGWLTIGLRGIEFRTFSIFYGYMDFFFTNVLIFAMVSACKDLWSGAWKRAYYFYTACWFGILALSLERMPIIMVLIVWLVLKYVRSSRTRRRKIVFASLATVGMLYGTLLLGGPILKTTGTDKLVRLAELANPLEATSMVDRIETKWLPALEIIKSNPIGVGIGYGSQTKASDSAAESENYIKPHNEIIQKTLETGIIGGVIYLLLMVAVFKDGLDLARLKGLGILGAGMVSSTLAFWACGIVNLPFSGSSGLLYWLMAGAVLGMKQGAFPSETSPKQIWEGADTFNGCPVQDETI
ncbi:MAG: hypothetical protein A2W25_01145 [candidate division Zixibacteria bacterium RBG_16_53_22]|nr:MAG: hypothetical protein A2W25_01145 [candidate division Zixibacteria bacterium RBG_16_53_22]